MKKLGTEDYILLGICVLVLIWLAFVMSGCSSVKRAQNIELIWHDGECLLVAEGVSAVQAKTMVSEWQFRECDINISGTEKSNGTKPVLPKE